MLNIGDKMNTGQAPNVGPGGKDFGGKRKVMDFKRDHRNKKGSWAPGDYVCKCCRCKEIFLGDKRATTCADCAYTQDNSREGLKKEAAEWVKDAEEGAALFGGFAEMVKLAGTILD
jgi:hypothetical protein